MRLEELTLRNFRNYESQALDFSGSGKVLFTGKNGQGKTNILEAVYFLSHARSERTTTDRELIRLGAGDTFATVTGVVGSHQYPDARTRLEVQWVLSDEGRLKTICKLNGSPLKSRSQLLGYLPSVSFFLSDLLLLRGSPENRRKWLDAAIVQYDKTHFSTLSDFQKVKDQKKRLLKNWFAGDSDERTLREHLDLWNAQFARTGAKLMSSRLRYLGLIQERVTVQYLELAGENAEPLAMSYQPSDPGLNNMEDSAQLQAALLNLLSLKATEEIRRGTCVVGPHRDDLLFTLSGMDATAYASQGQQRSIVLALKLSELELLTSRLGEPPILLLDDVMAELDPERQRFLIERVNPEIQVFFTTTHLGETLIPFVQDHLDQDETRLFSVHAGIARPQTWGESLPDVPLENASDTESDMESDTKQALVSALASGPFPGELSA